MNKLQKIFLSFLFSAFFLSGCLLKQEVPLAPVVNAESPVSEKDDSNEHILYGYPSTDCTILSREGYAVCHDNAKKVADWVSYHLTDEYLIKNADRSNDFRPDPDLPVGERSELKDYRGSGYDRGHLAPARDMARSERTMSESFLLSNMAPQVGVGFNRGIWKLLEEKVREWTEEKKSLYIITGPIYNDNEYSTIGSNKVAVPSHFYKVIVSCCENTEVPIDSIAFIFPNEKTSNDKLPEFITSIDEIEHLTGLDFLNNLDDEIENTIEAKKTEMW